MPLPILAGLAISAAAQAIAHGVSQNSAARKKDRENARLDLEYKKQADGLNYGYKNLQDAQIGQTSIDPEAQLALNNNEKMNSQLLAKSTRSATNSNEAMSAASGITNNAIGQAMRISAAEGARRRIAAENAAKTGLANQQALVQLDQQKQAAKRGAYQDINQYAMSETGFYSGLANDVASGMLYDKAYGNGNASGVNIKGVRGDGGGIGMNNDGLFAPSGY